MQLTDAQVITIALAVIIPLSLLIYSNSRITDAKETLRAETALLGTELRGEMALLRADVNAGFARIESDMKAGFTRIEHAITLHMLEHHK